MTVTFDEDKPSLDEFGHYGVKGMQWGKRKKYSRAEIKTARKRVNAIDRKAMDAEDRIVTAKTAAGRKKAEADFDKFDKQYRDSPDRAVAMRMTRGEKVATLLIGGPLGAVVIGVNAAATRHVEKSQAKNRK